MNQNRVLRMKFFADSPSSVGRRAIITLEEIPELDYFHLPIAVEDDPEFGSRSDSIEDNERIM